jgi:hypothetical protein
MNKTMSSLAVAAALTLGGSAQAQAQMSDGRKFFVSVNGGVQLSDRSITTEDSFPIYDEQATVTATQPVSGSAIFDIGGGVQITRGLFVGLAVNTYGDTAASSVTASIPDPLLFDTPRTVSLTASDLKRTERGTHLQIGWFVPVANKVDVAVFLGPSFVRLEQDFVSTVTVAPNTQNATAVVANESGTGTGFNLGVDSIYTFTPNVGAGFLIRWVRASVDLDSIPDAKASGFQIGVGGRLRF